MRRIISLLLTTVMLLSLFTVGFFTTTVAAAAADGSVAEGYTPEGTPISTEKEFLEMKPNGKYYLANDIKITSTYGMAYLDGNILNDPYGNPDYSEKFSGTFDGNGHTVDLEVPMFRYLDGATIKNLSTKGEINYRRDGMNVAYHCGSIAIEGEYLTFENVANNAKIKGYDTGKVTRVGDQSVGTETVLYARVYAGGLIGAAYGDLSMKNCVNNMPVTALCGAGLVGTLTKEKKDRGEETNKMKTYVTFENCHNYARISDDDCESYYAEEENSRVLTVVGQHAGLIASGIATEITFQDCTNTGDIHTGTDASPSADGACGGLSGKLSRSDDLGNNLTVKYFNCENNGDVVGTDQTGGIGGYSAGSVFAISCKNTGDITSRINYAAGIVGRGGADDNTVPCELLFENCVNSGTVTGHRQYAAGITTYSANRIKVNYCLNSGTICADGVTKNANNSPHGHALTVAGLIARSGISIELYYSVNTGMVLSNYSAAGIAGAIGSGSTSGYNTFFGCFSGGDVIAHTDQNLYEVAYDTEDPNSCHAASPIYCETDKDGNGICDETHCGGKIGEDYHKNYYKNGHRTIGAAGIICYSAAKENRQSPRVIGCGVTANITSTYAGAATAFIGYSDTQYVVIQGNYFTGTLNGPDTCRIPYNGEGKKDDFRLEYATVWVNNNDPQKYIKNNYYLESIKNSGALYLSHSGKEISWDGYDCFVTQEDVVSGKLCYLVNQAAYDAFIQVYPFVQDLSTDLYPKSPYYYLTYNGTLDNVSMDNIGLNIEIDYSNWVNVDANGNYVNEVYTPEQTGPIKPPEIEDDPDDSTADTDDLGTTTPETNPISTPETQPQTDPGGNGGNDGKDSGGGCGSMVGASLALAALAFAAPAVIVLRKKED